MKKQVKHRRNFWWTTNLELLCVGKEGRRCKRERQEEEQKSQSETSFGRRWLFLLLILVQNWVCIDAAAGRLEPEGEAEVPKIIVVSDVVRGTKVDLDGKSLQEEQIEKLPRTWKRSKGADWTEKRKEEVKVHLAKWISVKHRKEVQHRLRR